MLSSLKWAQWELVACGNKGVFKTLSLGLAESEGSKDPGLF